MILHTMAVLIAHAECMFLGVGRGFVLWGSKALNDLHVGSIVFVRSLLTLWWSDPLALWLYVSHLGVGYLWGLFTHLDFCIYLFCHFIFGL